MPETVPPRSDARSWGRSWVLRTVLVVAAGAGTVLYFYADTLIEQRLRRATVELLTRRFASEVELTSLRVNVGFSLHVRGEGLPWSRSGHSRSWQVCASYGHAASSACTSRDSRS
jgi:hypothetical protein